MASNNVAQFASELKMPADLLLKQLKAAGVDKSSAEDKLSKEDKEAARAPAQSSWIYWGQREEKDHAHS